ncbi:MAG TPA: transcription antitermination factor NusB [Actinomycetota bacterium]|nr:transcription antitermination factor NusB [Actinomycetota bacterium]
MKVRRSARRLAIDVLYEAEIRDMLPEDAFAARKTEGWVRASGSDDESEGRSSEEQPTPEVVDYALTLVRGVQARHADLDALIARYADRWAIERMPVIDRTVLRIALFELLWRDDVPVAVAINEAVELAKALSTEDSGRFINGLLGRIVEEETIP